LWEVKRELGRFSNVSRITVVLKSIHVSDRDFHLSEEIWPMLEDLVKRRIGADPNTKLLDDR
jgi:hypothetical protein